MTRRALAGGASVLLFMGWLAAPALASSLFVDAEAGGGYDSNMNAASNSSDAEDAGFGFASAALGIENEPGPYRAQVSAGWSGTVYDGLSDLSVNRLSLSAGLFARPAENLIASISPSLGGSFYGESDRNSFDLYVGLGLRWRVHPRLSLRPGYALVYQDARASEFDRTAHRFSLAFGADVWTGGYLETTYTFELGQVVRYLEQPVDSDKPGTGNGRPNNTFGRSLLAVQEDSTSSEITVRMEQALVDPLFVAAGAGYIHVSADPSSYDVFFASLSIGLRWP